MSKKTQLITDSGDSAAIALANLTNLNSWYYYPIAKSTNSIEIFITKLHKLSKYIFRFELYKSQNNKDSNVAEIFSLLALNSKDPVFFGYPYGLVDADKNARVSNNEKQYLKTIFSSKVDLSKYETTLNAHHVLDNIR